ncbi:glutathione S-transferase family protein [Pseudogemmobacter sp. W21_MBD1_M6]|uniref:glutathione S-transferase family protein n=1 Tax=Pseudogemmobacter sp. W21_MBD1_M6 TaxID=3240271 RepID=UPI003F9E2EE3
MRNVVLFGHSDSGHAYKVALALSLAGVAHQRRTVDIWADPASRPAEFLTASPFAEVPLLLADGEAMTQSASILTEIAQRSGMLGGDDADRMRRAREILFWEANRIGMCLPQLIEDRRVSGKGFPEGAVDWLRMRYAVDCARFDRLLGDSPFLLGDAPTIADCCVMGYAQWHEKAGVCASDAMARWLDRMRALPGYRTAAEFFPTA